MTVTQLAKAARQATTTLGLLSTGEKRELLVAVATEIVANTDEILKANAKDLAVAKELGTSEALLDRLALDRGRVESMAQGVVSVSKLPDPCGKVLESRTLANGLNISKVSVPFGVIGIIYESRPNVTSDAAALCLMAGSAVVLRGGKDAINSNVAIAKAMRTAVEKCGYDPNIISLVEDTSRDSSRELMRAKGLVDVLIPRGGAGLIKSVVENSLVPVIETGTGNCHAYVEKTAKVDMAVDIILNGKTSRPGVCNALESIVIDREALATHLPPVVEALQGAGVEVVADEEALPFVKGGKLATEEDFATEYLGLKISVKTVSGVEEAVTHINKNSTGHSEVIITEDKVSAGYFLNLVDSACTYWNASTRFTDGGEFDLGAEIGISTQKLHARGPMGLNEIVSYKYNVIGQGQVR